MPARFDHEKLDVYRLSIQAVGWTHRLVRGLAGESRNARDQLIRSIESVPLNIAEGVGKRPGRDRARYYETARGSALEAAATLDVLVAIGVRTEKQVDSGKDMLARVVAMLVKMAPPI